MSCFIKKMKSAAEQAKVKDHPLFTREYGLEIRNAYFFGAAASLCFLDDELDAEEQKALALLGRSLHLSSDEVSEAMKTVQGVGEGDKMEFLQEIFSLMDSDYLKFAILTDIRTLNLKKGQLTEDETDFIKTSSEILFGEEFDIFSFWNSGMKLDNINEYLPDDSPHEGKKSEWYKKLQEDLAQTQQKKDEEFREAAQAIGRTGEKTPAAYLPINCEEDADFDIPRCCICNKKMTRWIESEGRKYCSDECFQKSWPQCLCCGKPMKEWLTYPGGEKFCSEDCAKKTIWPKCLCCGKPMKEWLTYPGGEKFCSEDCAKKTIWPKCSVCGKPMNRWQEDENGRKYCSDSCYRKS